MTSFTDVWELKYENIGLLACLVYDLQRYHVEFAIAVVDQVMEDIRIGMEVGAALFGADQHRTTSSSLTNAAWRRSSTWPSCTCTVSSTPLSSLTSFGHSSPLGTVG